MSGAKLGRNGGYLGACEKDIHELMHWRSSGVGDEVGRLREHIELQRELIDCFESLVCVCDVRGRVCVWNKAAEQVSGFLSQQLIGHGGVFRRLIPDRQERRRIQRKMQEAHSSNRKQENIALEITCADGVTKSLFLTLWRQTKRSASRNLFIIVAQEATDLKQSQRQMEQLAFYDTLTNLPNRRLFRDRLSQSIDTSRRKGGKLAVMFIDLDRFKRINDSLGHDAGDELLREVAQRIAGCVRGQDTVARMGGDEFTVLLPEIGEAAAASTVANKISDVLRTPIDLDGHEVFITSSIGISIAPDDGEEPLVLLRNADLAMYRAKEKGRNNFRYFTEELNQQVNRQLQLETELRIAVEQGQFQMHYQPIYLSDGETIVAFEALLRWQHPNRGLVVPEEFIGALEETGLILDLAEWILQHSCLKAKQLQAQGRRLPMHVNLSARQFHRGDLPTLVARVLKQTALEPSLLYLEITETMLMEDIEQTLESLLTLKKLGVGLAIDDFGSGYSSLNYLKRFPVDVLKVDRSFVRNIPDEPQDMEITAAVIAMAHKLKLKVVAEGVETKEQLGFLRENDCDRVQGYYCSIPTDEDGLDYLLKISPKLHE